MPGGPGKVALVTGGSRRIGPTISRALATAGTSVVLTYRSSSVEGRRGIRTPEGVARAVLRFARPGTYNP